MADVAKILRRGDIFCHAYHGTGQTILSENGDVLPAIREARERGILFDMSHGNTNFSNAVCQKALAQGFPPDIISTDMGVVRFYQGRRVRSLPFVMSKLLSFGMTMIDVVRCVTATPAKSMNMSGVIGTLGAGARADITIVKKVAREVHFEDTSGSSCSGNVLLLPQMTMLSGQSVFIMNDFNL
jgi:predicted amidohydrolase